MTRSENRGDTLAIAILAAVLLVAPQSLVASPCPGDCNVDAVTGVDELVRCVNIALAASELATCTSCDQNNDSSVSIDELLQGVARAARDCRPDFVEAASGVTRSVVDAVDALRVLNFGYLGSLAALRGSNQSAGGGAGEVRCIQCPQGGSVSEYECITDNGTSRLTTVLDGCSDGTTVRSGQLELEIQDPTFCTMCSIGPGTVGAQSLTAYTETSNGRTLQVPQTVTEAFQIVGAGCQDRERPDKSSFLNGTLRVTGDSVDASFKYDNLNVAVTSQPLDGDLCRVTTIQTGIVSVDDSANNRRFVHASTNLAVTEDTLPGGGREVFVDTPAEGSLNVDCFGGEVRLATPENAPFAFPPNSACANSGELQVTFLKTGITSAIRAAAGGLQFDFDFDGVFEANEHVSNCAEASVSQCRIDLPAIMVPTPVRPSATSTPSETPTPTPSPTASSTSTATNTPTASSTATITPTSTATPTPTCRTVVTPGNVVNQTWTLEESPYCVTGDIDVSLLTIEPGVHVFIEGDFEIHVRTTITADGTAASPIHFTTRGPNVRWRGMRFNSTQPGSSFIHCIFENATGSAITLIDSVPRIEDCIFKENTGADFGGGVNALQMNSDLHLVRSKFIENTANAHGGALRAQFMDGASLVISDCEFVGNSANPSNGGGDHVGGAAWFETGQFQIFRSRFVNNKVAAVCNGNCGVYARGGAIYLSNGSMSVDGLSEFVGNETFANDGTCLTGCENRSHGAGIYVDVGNLTLANTVMACNTVRAAGCCGVERNRGRFGSSVYVRDGSVQVINATVANNEGAPAIYVQQGSLDVRNSILFFNNGEMQQVEGIPPSIAYSDIQNGFGDEEDNNIGFDPAFAGRGCEAPDFLLLEGSAAIDRGDPTTIFNDECLPPSLGTERNDMGAFGGPGACDFQFEQ